MQSEKENAHWAKHFQTLKRLKGKEGIDGQFPSCFRLHNP